MAPLTIAQLSTDQPVCELPCRVSRKWIAYNSKKDTVICLEFVLIDAEGTDIWVRVPKDIMKNFQDRVEEQRFYEFSKFSVKLTQKDYRPVGNPLMIEFTDDTVFRLIQEIPATPTYKFRFLKTSDLPDYNNKVHDLMDAYGVLKSYGPIETHKSSTNRTPRRDMTIQFSDGHIIKVSLWGRTMTQLDSIVDPTGNATTVVVATSLLVKIWNKQFYLSSSSATRLYANLNIPEIAAEQERIPRNNAPQFIATNQAPIIPNVTIEELLALRCGKKEQKTLELDCVVSSIKENWYYNGCATATCRRLVREEVDGFFCGKCKTTTKESVKRFRIVIAVSDQTDSTELVLLDHSAEKHLDISAQALFTQTEGDVSVPPPKLQELKGNQLKLHVRISDYDFANPSSRLTIMSILEATETTRRTQSAVKENEADIQSAHSSSLSFTVSGSPPRSPTQVSPDNFSSEVPTPKDGFAKGTPTTNYKRKHDAIVECDE